VTRVIRRLMTQPAFFKKTFSEGSGRAEGGDSSQRSPRSEAALAQFPHSPDRQQQQQQQQQEQQQQQQQQQAAPWSPSSPNSMPSSPHGMSYASAAAKGLGPQDSPSFYDHNGSLLGDDNEEEEEEEEEEDEEEYYEEGGEGGGEGQPSSTRRGTAMSIDCGDLDEAAEAIGSYMDDEAMSMDAYTIASGAMQGGMQGGMEGGREGTACDDSNDDSEMTRAPEAVPSKPLSEQPSASANGGFRLRWGVTGMGSAQ